MDKVELMKLLDGITSPISRIEQKLGMPKSTIQKVKNGERTLSAEWEKVLRGFVERKEYIGLKRKKPKGKVIMATSPAVFDMEKPTEIVNDEPPKVEFRKRFMSDAMRKRLGI